MNDTTEGNEDLDANNNDTIDELQVNPLPTSSPTIPHLHIQQGTSKLQSVPQQIHSELSAMINDLQTRLHELESELQSRAERSLQHDQLLSKLRYPYIYYYFIFMLFIFVIFIMNLFFFL